MVSGIGEQMSSSILRERFSTSNVVGRGQTTVAKNAEVLANQESTSRQAAPPNTDGKGFGLPPLSINTGRATTEGFGIRSRSWHSDEVGLHCPILFIMCTIINILIVSKYYMKFI